MYYAKYQIPPLPESVNSIAGLLSTLDSSDSLDKSAYIDATTGQSITFRNYMHLVPRVAALLQDEFEISKGDVVMLFASNSFFTPVIYHATMWLGAIISPVHAQYNARDLAHHLRLAKPKLVLASDFSVAAEATERAGGNNQIFEFQRFVSKLQSVIKKVDSLEVPPVPVDPNTTGLLLFSSGTSGLPKAVVISHHNVLQNAFQVSESGSPFTTEDLPIGAFLPLSHLYGIIQCVWSPILQKKTVVIFEKFDFEMILAKCSEYKVGIIFVVPATLLLLGKDPLVDKYPLFKKCIKYIICSAAPLPESTAKLATKRLPGMKLCQFYGVTEMSGVCLMGGIYEGYNMNTVGWLVPGLEARLVDPETGEDVAVGEAGELWFRGPQTMKGYLSNPTATSETITPEGWLKSGDIAVADETEQFQIVDRTKDVIKSKGHQVSPTELESILVTNENVIDAAVIGIPDETGTTELPRAFLVVRPNTDILKILRWFNDIVSPPKRLSGGAIAIDKIPTGATGKLLRRSLREIKVDTDSIVGKMPSGFSSGDINKIRANESNKPILQSVIDTVIALLGDVSVALPDSKFTDIGGDSLTALALSSALSRIHDVPVPVALITSPTTNLQSIADHIELQRKNAAQISFSDIHKRYPNEISSTELILGKFIDAHTLADVPYLQGINPKPRNIFLTGATGFLGRHLALQLLDYARTMNGKVICLVRAANEIEGQARLRSGYDRGDPNLLAYYDRLARDHLEVVVGDQAYKKFNLNYTAWEKLAKDVDVIFDSAALVNHVLPYHEHFGPNVVGTAEVIRLALSFKLKPISYVSTIVVGDNVAGEKFNEDIDVRVMSPLRKIDDSYANGYSNSKWAGEVLLREAYDLCELPSTVFRCGMILGSETYLGQINEQDMFSRILLSLVATKLAPGSFYELSTDGERQKSHYDALPVDFVAKAISTLGLTPAEFEIFSTYHVFNPHDDGIGMDEYVDWLIRLGHDIQRVPNYSDWFNQFERSLKKLPLKQQSASTLPLLDKYRIPEKPHCGSAYSTDRFSKAIKDAEIDHYEDIPRIEQSIIAKYIKDLRHIELL